MALWHGDCCWLDAHAQHSADVGVGDTILRVGTLELDVGHAVAHTHAPHAHFDTLETAIEHIPALHLRQSGTKFLGATVGTQLLSKFA